MSCLPEHRVAYRKAHRAEIGAYHKWYTSQTVKGYTATLWRKLRARTVNGGLTNKLAKGNSSYFRKGVELRITRMELELLVRENWSQIKTIREGGDIPSIDRIGPSIHYEIGNLQFIPYRKNMSKAGKATKNLRPRYVAI